MIPSTQQVRLLSGRSQNLVIIDTCRGMNDQNVVFLGTNLEIREIRELVAVVEGRHLGDR